MATRTETGNSSEIAGTTTVVSSPPLVVDMVSDVCRIEGFEVQRDFSDGDETNPLSISLLARRKDADGVEHKVAFECSERDTQVTGKDIEEYASRLKVLGLENGVYVCPKGFTNEAEYIAKKLGVELWDLAKLKERFEKIKTPEKTRVPSILPLSRGLPERILSSTLENRRFLKPMGWPKLEYRPYYFAEFQVHPKKRRVAKGLLVFDGVDGRVCDANLLQGELDGLPATGLFLECLEIQPSTGSLPELPKEMEVKETVAVAGSGLTEEAVPGRAIKVLVDEAKADPQTINITKVSMLHVPLVTVELGAGQRAYRKIFQAATGKVIWDETLGCGFCSHPSRSVCEVCVRTTCYDHQRICSKCKKHLCSQCAEVKGILNKAVFCPDCKE